MKAVVLSLSLACGLVGPAWAAEPAPCVIVHGQGLNLSPGDTEANDMWNDLNRAFSELVSRELQAAGRRTVVMASTVGERDPGQTLRQILQRAHQEHCDTLVHTAVFADPVAQRFISRLRVHAIIGQRRADAPGLQYSLGDEAFAQDQQDPLTRETLASLVPGDIARRLVRAYIATPAR